MSERDFDGQVLSVVQGGIEHRDNEHADSQQTFILEKGNPTAYPIALEIFKLKKRLAQLIAVDFPSVFIEYNKCRIKEHPVSELPKRIQEILFEGKLRTTFLINSSGGRSIWLESVEAFLEDAKRRKGYSRSFVSVYAESTAAIVTESADERHAFEGAECTWHTGEASIQDEDLVDEELAQMRLFFAENASPKHLGNILKRIQSAQDDASNPQSDVTFTGKELQEFGVNHAAYPSLEDFFATLMQDGTFDEEEMKRAATTPMSAMLPRSFFAFSSLISFFALEKGADLLLRRQVMRSNTWNGKQLRTNFPSIAREAIAKMKKTFS